LTLPPNLPGDLPPTLDIRRGLLLGLPIFVALIISAVVVYLFAGALGWSGNGRVVLAMCAGPFIGLAIIGVFFIIARPKIT